MNEDQYRISMAVAGFDRTEIEIETERDVLKVVGRKAKPEVRHLFTSRYRPRDF